MKKPTTPPRHHCTLSGLPAPARLDRALRDAFPQWGRQAVQRLIAGRNVTVNGKQVWLASWQVKNGDRIEVFADPQTKSAPVARFDERWIVADEPHWLVVNKPAGLLSHRTRWANTPGLLELAHARGDELTLFHRLDRDTSGLVVLARTEAANRYLDQIFKARTVTKEYLAVVATPNQLAAQGEIRLPLAPDSKRRDKMQVVRTGGKWALTNYAVLGETDGRQLVRCWPISGRTHQLRVHLAALDAPIIGDRLYAQETRFSQRLMLHSWRLTLPAMAPWPQRLFTAPLPPEFAPFNPFLADLQ
ncbi:MAG: RluA family pseudouridine synthase [Caldilineaceae bacterium]|nr:RluA family pseudouridine synthase [Caldilineaceae bacterium]